MQYGNIFEKLQKNLGIRVGSYSNLETHLLLRESQLIGALGAANALSGYILNKQDSCGATDSFIEFYCHNSGKSRSQWSQDIFAMYFSLCKEGGIYLEIGGADGVTHSNTLALRDHWNWHGVLVEPDPVQFKVLRRTRGSSDRIINAALDPTGCGGAVQLRRAGQYSAVVGHEGQDMHYDYRIKEGKKTNVNSIDLTALIAEIGDIDYFSLDIEGAEATILQSLRWNEITPPALITVEHNNREEDKKKLRSLLTDAGYLEVFADQEWLTLGDLWMVHQRQKQRLPAELASLLGAS